MSATRRLSPLARAWLLLVAVGLLCLAGAFATEPGQALAAPAVAPEAFDPDLDAGMIDDDEPSRPGPGPKGPLLIGGMLVLLIAMGSPLFVIIGVLASMCFLLYSEGYDDWGACSTLDPATICGFDMFPAKMAGLTTKNVLLAIPFFVVSGAIMSAGDIANRLVAFARALVGWLPGGLAIATVGGCIFFAAISGSSPVTVIAIGAVMYPALVKAGYQERFSLGLVTTAGSLGIVIPPSIPMLVFAIFAGGATPIDVGELFMSGIGPGLMIGVMLAAYSAYVALRDKSGERTAFSWPGLWVAFRDGLWAILLPVQILGGIYSGLFTPTEAAAVSVVYALVVELFIHRQLTVHHLPKILGESAVMMGSLLVIMALAFGLNDFLVEEKVPDRAVKMIQDMNLGTVEFLLVMNLLLLVAGALMDSISAIMIIAPLLAPVGIQLGIDPVHLGIIFIVNLEIGYLTPPIGLNLFVASSVFGKPLGEVIKSVVPFILVLLVGLGIVTYVPTVAMGPVNVILRNEPFYEPLPLDRGAAGREGAAVRPDMPVVLAPGEGEGETRVKSMRELTGTNEQINEQLLAMCDAAEDVMSKTPPPADPIKAWLDALPGEGVDNVTVLELAKDAAAHAGTKAAFEELDRTVEARLKTAWECDDLQAMLDRGGGAKAPAPPAP
ncbi:MAG: TRAP transporter large permease [Nannocystaceae bacterium]